MRNLTTIRTYSELQSIDSYEKRFEYLKLGGFVGHETFGYERQMNQMFYKSSEWRRARKHVIARDFANDMGHHDYPIVGNVYVHHMNPITVADLEDFNKDILDPEFLISVSLNTHNAIHYGSSENLISAFVERRPGDTKLW